MRGFPLLNTILVAAAFLIAGWPLRQLATSSGGGNPEGLEEPVHDHGHLRDADEPEPASARPLDIRIFSSAPLNRLRIEHLGKLLVEKSGEFGEWQCPVGSIAIPEEGIELWIDAEFAEGKPVGRAALGLELTPGDRESVTRTLWTDGTTAADSVVFTWDE